MTPLETLHDVIIALFGWDHDHPLPQPECVTGKRDNPIGYYDPEEPEDPLPFDAEAINTRLHKLTT